MSIVYTGGTFDLFHAGHVNFLKNCKSLAGPSGLVVVGLNSDAFIRRYKNKAPICSQEDRQAVLESCRYVDRVIINKFDEDSKPIIEQVAPKYVVIGSDWARKDYYSQMSFTQDWLDARGIILVYVPYTAGISSTAIRGLLQ